MGTVRTDEFRKDAVRIALTSGLSRKQVADDLGVGMSTLNKWITAHRDTDVVSQEDRELAIENDRLRRENRILREERDILKKATVGSTGQRNIFDLRCSERTYDVTKWSPWIVTRAEGRTLAPMEGWGNA